MALYLSKKPRRTFLCSTYFITLVVLYLTILSFSSSFFVKAEGDCSVTNGTTNKYYDLSPLTRTDGKDWIVTGNTTEGNEGNEWTFYINICNDVSEDKEHSEGFGVYGKHEGLGNHGISFGKSSNEPKLRGDKLVMEFSEGGQCVCGASCSLRKFSAISFICDQNIEGKGQPKFVSGFKDCAIFFEWRTSAACPKDKKSLGNGWGVFVTIFAIALIVYFIGGVIYNRTVHNAIGIRQIPNWEFWSNTCDFLKDMILIILAQCAQCPTFNSRRSGGRHYRNLPRDEEDILIGEEFEEH